MHTISLPIITSDSNTVLDLSAPNYIAMDVRTLGLFKIPNRPAAVNAAAAYELMQCNTKIRHPLSSNVYAMTTPMHEVRNGNH
jgi:hypothetical protein